MTRTALLFLLWLAASIVMLCFNVTFWIGLGSLALCIFIGHHHYDNGGNDAQGVC